MSAKIEFALDKFYFPPVRGGDHLFFNRDHMTGNLIVMAGTQEPSKLDRFVVFEEAQLEQLFMYIHVDRQEVARAIVQHAEDGGGIAVSPTVALILLGASIMMVALPSFLLGAFFF